MAMPGRSNWSYSVAKSPTAYSMVSTRYPVRARHSGCSTDMRMTRTCLAISPTPGPGPPCPRILGRGALGLVLLGLHDGRLGFRGSRLGGLLGLGRFRDPPLGGGRVDVDVLLAGELHDLVHDLVGHRAQYEAVVLHALVAAEVQRLADADPRPHQLGHDLARRLDLLGVDHGDRDDRGAAGERHAREAA